MENTIWVVLLEAFLGARNLTLQTKHMAKLIRHCPLLCPRPEQGRVRYQLCLVAMLLVLISIKMLQALTPLLRRVVVVLQVMLLLLAFFAQEALERLLKAMALVFRTSMLRATLATSLIKLTSVFKLGKLLVALVKRAQVLTSLVFSIGLRHSFQHSRVFKGIINEYSYS